jgi:hypothetical protein
LAGGRRTEAMRTHRIAESTVYKILHSFCKAVNECPVFDLNYNIDYYTLMKRAEEFYAKSFISLFKYCCGALDGLAIKVNVRSDDTYYHFIRVLNIVIALIFKVFVMQIDALLEYHASLLDQQMMLMLSNRVICMNGTLCYHNRFTRILTVLILVQKQT